MAHSNLTPLRGPNVWDRRDLRAAGPSRDALERTVIGAAGLMLLALGLGRRTTTGRLIAVAGASVLALAGTPGVLDRAHSWTARQRWRWTHRDEVTDQSVQSFPASDSPGWTATTGTGGADTEANR